MTRKNRSTTKKRDGLSIRPTRKSKVIIIYLHDPSSFLLTPDGSGSPPESDTCDGVAISPDECAESSNAAGMLPSTAIIGENFTLLRNRKGVTLQEVAATNKIPIKRLQTLERGKLRISPDSGYNRRWFSSKRDT